MPSTDLVQGIQEHVLEEVLVSDIGMLFEL